MKNKITLILGIVILVMGCINGFAQHSQSSEQEKVDQLIKKFCSLSYGERGSMSEAFREIGDPIIEPLIEMLRNKKTSGWSQYRIEWHQRRIAWALEKIPSDKAVKSLIVALKDADEEVRMWAAEALKRIGTPEALKAVESALRLSP